MPSIPSFTLTNSVYVVWGVQAGAWRGHLPADTALLCLHSISPVLGSVGKGSYRKIPSQHKEPFRVLYCWPFPQQGNLGEGAESEAGC